MLRLRGRRLRLTLVTNGIIVLWRRQGIVVPAFFVSWLVVEVRPPGLLAEASCRNILYSKNIRINRIQLEDLDFIFTVAQLIGLRQKLDIYTCTSWYFSAAEIIIFYYYLLRTSFSCNNYLTYFIIEQWPNFLFLNNIYGHPGTGSVLRETKSPRNVDFKTLTQFHISSI